MWDPMQIAKRRTLTLTGVRTLGLIALSTLGTAACGGGSSSGSNPNGAPVAELATDAPETTSLNMLTPMQQADLCTGVNSYFEQAFSSERVDNAVCRAVSLQFAAALAGLGGGNQSTSAEAMAQTRELCETSYDTCVEQGPDSLGVGVTPAQFTGAFNCDQQALADCGSSVAELEQCLNQYVDVLYGVFNEIPGCDAAGTDAMVSAETFAEVMLPAVCEPIVACNGMTGTVMAAPVPSAGTAGATQ